MLDVSLSMMSREIGKSLLQHRDMMSKGMCGCEGERAVFYRKLCCVQCPARSGAVHVQLVSCASNGYGKAHKIVICGGSGPEMWMDW